MNTTVSTPAGAMDETAAAELALAGPGPDDAITTAGLSPEEEAAAGLAPAPEGVPTGTERATWKGHGNPTSFIFYGAGSLPEAPGVKITKVSTSGSGLTLKRGNGRPAKGGSFGVATKFWAGACVLPEAPAPAAASPRRAAAVPVDPKATPSGLAVLAGPPAWLGANGEVLPMSATAYPELAVAEGVLLRCLGECGQLKKAGAFPCTANKGDGKGRYLECGACQAKRLAANKAGRAVDPDAELAPRPRATVQAPAAE
jgi:hypothetical protein